MTTVHHDGSHSRGRSAPDACSVEWDAATTESLYGTAAPARFWVIVEQNGPWGRTAATQSYLPADVGDELTLACRAAGGRLGLIRRPGEHADPRTGPRLCYLAWSGPQPFLLVGRVETPEDLLRLPFAALAAGDREAVAAALPQFRPSAPIFLVCTNGRHDVCCAIRGRPVALAGHQRYPGRVWECSHTGGHRFSPTGVLLPWGRTLGPARRRLGRRGPRVGRPRRPASSACSGRGTTVGAAPTRPASRSASRRSATRSARPTSRRSTA